MPPRRNESPNGKWFRTGALALIMCLCEAPALPAQGEITGRVVASDSGRPPISGVEVGIPRLTRSALSDSSGRFRLPNLPVGTHAVVFRAIGFTAETSSVFVDVDESVSMQVVMTRATMLPERVVTAPEQRAPAKLVEFVERQKAGIGHFIDRRHLERAEGGMRQTGDVISQLPGVQVRRGGNKAWVATGRAVGGGTCAFCPPPSPNPADRAAGARSACYMDVYLDGAMVFDSRNPGYGLFDVNTLQPEHIAAIEAYTSTAQIPARYNRTGGGCGVLLIWTR